VEVGQYFLRLAWRRHARFVDFHRCVCGCDLVIGDEGVWCADPEIGCGFSMRFDGR
jgi:hypothetical protein